MFALVAAQTKFLNCCADQLTPFGLEQGAQLIDIIGLMHRAHEFGGRNKVVIELIVEIVAVDLDHNCRVETRPATQDAGEVDHGEAFARPLCVPDDTDALIVRVRPHFSRRQ